MNGTYSYDALGRQTSLPAADATAGTSAGNLSVGYFDNDLARTITQNGKTTTYGLDVAGRRSSQVSVAGGVTTTVARHYTDTSDSPGWATTTTGGATTTTRYASGINGDLAATLTGTALTLNVTDPLGSVATSLTVGSTPLVGALGTYDEYGNTIAAGPSTGAINYGWLGGKERATDRIRGLTHHGTRGAGLGGTLGRAIGCALGMMPASGMGCIAGGVAAGTTLGTVGAITGAGVGVIRGSKKWL